MRTLLLRLHRAANPDHLGYGMTDKPVRKAATPWRARSIKPSPKAGIKTTNAKRQLKAIRAMSVLEQECGITPAQHDAFHAEQRANVFKRYGIKP